MRAVVPLTGRMPINVRPEIVRLLTVHSAQTEYSAQMPFWSLHFFHARMYLEIEDYKLDVQPGQALMTPMGVRTYSRLRGGHTCHFAHFHLPVAADTEYVDAPVLLDMQDDYPRLNAVFADAARCCSASRLKAEVGLWYILQALFGPQGGETQTRLPGKLAFALRMIDERIGALHTIEELARHTGISARHLNRLFVGQFGISAADFLREKRLLLAKHLLQTTDYLVKEIGAQVGLPGPHHFNNMIRERFGCTPLQLRRAFRENASDGSIR